MRGCLSFLIFLGVLAAVGILVLPWAVGLLIAGAISSAGFTSSGTDVNVQGWGGDLLTGRAPGIEVRARDARYREISLGSVDVTFHDVNVLDRGFRAIDGEASDVTIPIGGRQVTLTNLQLSGPVTRTAARARISAGEVVRLVQETALERLGVSLDVTFSARGVELSGLGERVLGRVSVTRGTLLVDSTLGSFPVLSGATSDPWRLTGATTDASGLTVTADIDLARAIASGAASP